MLSRSDSVVRFAFLLAVLGCALTLGGGVAGGAFPANSGEQLIATDSEVAAPTETAVTTDDGKLDYQVEPTVNQTYNLSQIDRATAVVVRPEGGYRIAGYTLTADGDRDGVILTVAANGSLESTRRFGGPEDEFIYDLVRTTDGGYAFVGKSGTYEATEAWIVKVGPGGAIAFNYRFGDSGAYQEAANALVATDDGGIAVVSKIAEAGPSPGTGPFFLRLDDGGNPVAAEGYDTATNRSANDLVATGDGGYLIVGGEGFGYAGFEDPVKAWASRINATGHPLWTETLRNGSASAVIRANDGGYVIHGEGLTVLDAGAPGWLQKIDADGDSIWAREPVVVPSPGSSSIAHTSDGGYVLAGKTRGGMVFDPRHINGILERYTATGTETWNKTLGVANTTRLNAVIAVGDGRYATVGRTNGSIWLLEFTEPSSNDPPTARTGPDRTVPEGMNVTLDGLKSGDGEVPGWRLRYDWTQISGPNVTLSRPRWPTTSFTAPEVDGEVELTFRLEVTDPELASDSTLVNVTVEDAATVSRVAFDYDDFGGNVNLEINGDRRVASNLADLDGQTVGGATVTVPKPATDASTGEGTTVVTGTVSSFSVGGQEFVVDNVTFGPKASPQADVEFASLTPAQSSYVVGDEFTSPSGVAMRVESYHFPDGDTYRDGTGSRSGGEDPAFWPGNVNLAFNIRSVVNGSGAPPEFVERSLRVTPYPVEVGDLPSVLVRVTNADHVVVEATANGETDRLRMTNISGNDLWEGRLSQLDEFDVSSLEPGTEVDLRVIANNSAGNVTLERYFGGAAHNVYLNSSADFDYTVFEETRTGVVVMGRFADEAAFETGSFDDKADVGQWTIAQELDVNNFYGSANGTTGAVGFDLTFRTNSGQFYEVPSPRSEYEVAPDNAPNQYVVDLYDVSKDEIAYARYDFWIATHAGESIGRANLCPAVTRTPADPICLHIGTGITEPPAMYVSATDLSGHAGHGQSTWNHEFGHAAGFGDLYKNGRANINSVGLLMGKYTKGAVFGALSRLGYNNPPDLDPEFGWVEREEIGIGTLPADGKQIEVSPVRDLGIGDEVPVVQETRVNNRYDVMSTFVPEVRSKTHGALVWIYEVTPNYLDSGSSKQLLGGLAVSGDTFRTRIDAAYPLFVEFEYVGSTDSGVTLSVTPDSGRAGSTTVALDDSTSVDQGVGSAGEIGGSVEATPDLDLVAVDSQGRRVGVTATGTYVNEIPGANASGDTSGLEWISVPEDADVQFYVSSDDVAAFLNATNVSRENVTVQYRTSITHYGENPQVEQTDEGYAVTNMTTEVTENRSVEPGSSVPAINKTVVAGIDVSPTSPDPNETVIFDGSLSVGLNTSIIEYEWKFPDGTIMTGSTVTRRFKTAGTWNATLTITGADGATDTTTVNVAVVPPAPDVNGNGRRATDPDDDGLYEDVDGDGGVNIIDVAVLLSNLDSPAVSNSPDAFDFKPDVTINILDVAALLNAI